MRSLQPDEFDGVFRRIGKEWMLLTVKKPDGTANPMTASWGGLGWLWNKPVVFLFIRPQRYTFELAERAERLSVSFLEEKYRGALRLCGTLSGRDTDKFAAAGLTVATAGGVPCPAEAHTVLICRKLFAEDLEKSAFLDTDLLKNYPTDDFHRMYICEIESIYQKEEL